MEYLSNFAGRKKYGSGHRTDLCVSCPKTAANCITHTVQARNGSLFNGFVECMREFKNVEDSCLSFGTSLGVPKDPAVSCHPKLLLLLSSYWR